MRERGRDRWWSVYVSCQQLLIGLGESFPVIRDVIIDGHHRLQCEIVNLDQELDVDDECLADHRQHLIPSLGSADAARHFRRIGDVVVGELPNDNCVGQTSSRVPSEVSLFLNVVPDHAISISRHPTTGLRSPAPVLAEPPRSLYSDWQSEPGRAPCGCISSPPYTETPRMDAPSSNAVQPACC